MATSIAFDLAKLAKKESYNKTILVGKAIYYNEETSFFNVKEKSSEFAYNGCNIHTQKLTKT